MAKSCASCSLSFDKEDYVKCSGICERLFHGTLKCSGIRNEAAKLIQRNNQVHYVCEECQKIKITHILQAVHMCNENVLNLTEKIDEMAGVSSKIMRRVSSLEHCINDINFDSDQSKSKLDGNFLTCIEKSNDQFLSRILSGIDSRVKSVVDRQTLYTQNTYATKKQLEKSVMSQNELLSKMDETNKRICDDIQKTEVELKAFMDKVICDKMNLSSEKTPNAEVVENESSYLWLYVASSSSNFGENALRNYIRRKFGRSNMNIVSLSNSVSATYRSFKVSVSSGDIDMFMDLGQWPSCTYVRIFEVNKKSVSENHGRKPKENFVHNPRRTI